MGLMLRKKRDGTHALRADPPQRHHFSTKFVQEGAVEGWITLGAGKVTLHLSDGDVAYRILRGPGAYCLHCGERIGRGAGNPAETARRRDYIGQCQQGPGEPRPDYEVADYFDCELEG